MAKKKKARELERSGYLIIKAEAALTNGKRAVKKYNDAKDCREKHRQLGLASKYVKEAGAYYENLSPYERRTPLYDDSTNMREVNAHIRHILATEANALNSKVFDINRDYLKKCIFRK